MVETAINVQFLGAQFDKGLAWVHFPEGFGGLGFSPKAQAHVEQRLRKAGAPPADPLAAAAKEPGAKVTASGLVIRMLTEGKGAQPTATSVVNVHYKGTFPDGREFDSSYKRGEPTEFPLNRVIKCWTEGVGLMKTGGKANPKIVNELLKKALDALPK